MVLHHNDQQNSGRTDMGEPTRQKSNIGHRARRVEAVKVKLELAKDLLYNRERFWLSVQKSVARAQREVKNLERKLAYEQSKLADFERQALHTQRKRAASDARKREANNASSVNPKASSSKI